METTKLFLCKCSSREHQIIMETDDEWRSIYCSVHLVKTNFWNRLKYLFGYQCRYGAFEEFILAPKHADELQKIVDKLREYDKKDEEELKKRTQNNDKD